MAEKARREKKPETPYVTVPDDPNIHPLRLLRIRRWLTLKAMARVCNVHYSALSQIENRRIVPSRLQRTRISRALGVDAVDLFGPEA